MVVVVVGGGGGSDTLRGAIMSFTLLGATTFVDNIVFDCIIVTISSMIL